MCVLGRRGGDIKYGYEIFTTGRRGGRRGGRGEGGGFIEKKMCLS